eukprot:CAMPEP_0116147412 /NCGR_PEP_ID=MMETSP0329-20121206/17741_1 /TAXON_ID=697910 /ORGANISM="Pseudo-nitzschia arenysensis, Strain B593" /LENGTH=316 /DNA_ID=CAMNT_0003643339 /DNA_START=209 /DNA_END=1159 /DNA_ORIENTATION=+
MITRNLSKAAVFVAAAFYAASSNVFVNAFAATTIGSSRQCLEVVPTTDFGSEASCSSMSTTSTALYMGRGGGVRARGLEQRREGPTPTVGGMVLYLKAAEDGKSAGDCPFAHYIRLILEERGLPYSVEPCAGPDDKPNWLLDYYEGKLPCLRHKKEAYVESNVIAAYVDYFFPSETKPTQESKAALDDAEEALNGFFPAVAGFLKDIEGDDDESAESLGNLKEKLTALEGHLDEAGEGYLDLSGNNESFSVLDCRLVPQLYHLKVGIEKFKSNRPNLETEFPNIYEYLQRSMDRPSFQATQYSPETIEWGWSNARQ